MCYTHNDMISIIETLKEEIYTLSFYLKTLEEIASFKFINKKR